MNGTDIDEITAYVDAVRAALSGLPESTRNELLEDLPEHLAEVAADDVGTLVDRLGPPSVYAAELLASAGFVGGFPDPPPSRTNHLAEIRETTLRRLRVVDAKTGPVFGYERISDFLVLLRPAWWVLRGYLAAMVLAWILDDSGQPIGLVPRIGGSEAVALVLLAASVWASIWLGRRAPGLSKGPKYALWAGTAVLVLVAMGGFLSADRTSRGSFYSDVSFTDPYGHVQDVFVYDEQGQLVEGARLFDQNGQPIKLGSPWCDNWDEFGNQQRAADESKYPYCPQSAPFRMPGAAAPRAVDPTKAPTPAEPSASAAEPTAPAPSASTGSSARPSPSTGR